MSVPWVPPAQAEADRPEGDDGSGATVPAVDWIDLTGFQRDLLKAIRFVTKQDRIPTGQTIKERLETQYDGEINNGRLYQNLGQLVENDLIEKGFVDGRTNIYSLTGTATTLLDETAHQLVDICGIDVTTRTDG